MPISIISKISLYLLYLVVSPLYSLLILFANLEISTLVDRLPRTYY
jgi:hypothetical protein